MFGSARRKGPPVSFRDFDLHDNFGIKQSSFQPEYIGTKTIKLR